MQRGLNDQFYYALRDDGAASDSLNHLKFSISEETGGIMHQIDAVPAACTGEILALELDPLNSNDIESYYHDNDSLDEWLDKLDRIWIIDGRLNLFKLCLEREVRTIKQVPLLKFKSVQTILETTMRGVDFIRISVTDRCFTIFGKTINYETGQEWDFYPEVAD